MRNQTFRDFNAAFFSKFSDAAIFDFEDVNLLKVAQTGLKVQFDTSKISRKGLLFSVFTEFVKALILRIRSSDLVQHERSEVARFRATCGRRMLWFIDDNVTTDSDGMKSKHFGRLSSLTPKDRCAFILNSRTRSSLPYDLQTASLKEYSAVLAGSYINLKLLIKLLQAAKRLSRTTSFSEIEIDQIRVAYMLFWRQYILWKALIRDGRPKRIFFIQHYHNEGMLYAFKEVGTECIELQHGLIAKDDVFYVYPEQIKPISQRMLFSDRILVFGEFWKDTLLSGGEFSEQQIDVIGEYRVVPKALIASEPILKLRQQYEHLILITGQYRIYQYFNDYIDFLSSDIISKGQNAHIIFKPHPNAIAEHWSPLLSLPNVAVSADSLTSLMKLADVHVSIYSTTLYEAVTFEVANFSLWVKGCADYVESILESGVCSRLEMNENPLEKVQEGQRRGLATTYFKKFDSDKWATLTEL